MDSNTHSPNGTVGPPDQPAAEPVDDEEGDLVALAALLDRMAARDLDRLTDPVRARRAVRLRPMVDRLEGQWLKEVAGVDARGAAGADQGVQVGSTAGWLRARLRMGRDPAATVVRTARALFRGPLPQTATALMGGEISLAHAEVLAAGTKDLPAHVAMDAEANLVNSARALDPTELRRVVGHMQYTLDPEDADAKAQRRLERQGLWLTVTLDRMVAIGGQLDPEAGRTLLAALEPLARPADANDTRSGSQRNADALTELARRQLEAGQLPTTGGVRPQLSVLVDLDSLDGQPGAIGGDTGWAEPLSPQACRRLACDAAVTRVLSAASPPTPVRSSPADSATLRICRHQTWRACSGRSWPSCPRSSVGRPPSRWMWAAPPGWSARPSVRPWPCATAAVCSRAAAARSAGAKPIMCGTGCTAARPTWPTWPWSAGNITGPSTTAAGTWPADPTGATPPPHRAEDTTPSPDPAVGPPTANLVDPPGPMPQPRRPAPAPTPPTDRSRPVGPSDPPCPVPASRRAGSDPGSGKRKG
jgi:hypothetical protein